MTETLLTFHSNEPTKEIMRVSRDGVWVDPDIPTNEAAQSVIAALDEHIKHLTGTLKEEIERLQAERDHRKHDILAWQNEDLRAALAYEGRQHGGLSEFTQEKIRMTLK